MKNGIKSKTYYALLEWKDKNMDLWLYYATEIYHVERLCDMSTEQLKDLADKVLSK